MKRILPLSILASALLLTACEPSGNDPGPGGVTVDEAKALDEAAEMIEAQRLPEGALPQGLQADSPVELPPTRAAPASADNPPETP